jgi:hypothetical protein
MEHSVIVVAPQSWGIQLILGIMMIVYRVILIFWLSVISTVYVCSANEPVQWRMVRLRERTGHSAEEQPQWMD